jgi:hypothetical protein
VDRGLARRVTEWAGTVKVPEVVVVVMLGILDNGGVWGCGLDVCAVARDLKRCWRLLAAGVEGGESLRVEDARAGGPCGQCGERVIGHEEQVNLTPDAPKRALDHLRFYKQPAQGRNTRYNLGDYKRLR